MLGEILMINRRALSVASGKSADNDILPVVLADFSVNGIIEMNRDLITDYGGVFAGENNLRENCLGRLEYTVNMLSGDYLPDDTFYKLAWLWERLIMSHLFNDGNKRVALASMLAYAYSLGITLYMPSYLVDRIQRQIVNHSIDLDTIARQLKKCQ